MPPLLNGAAGKQNACAQLDQIRERLAPLVADCTDYPGSNSSDVPVASRRAVRNGADLVVAQGDRGRTIRRRNCWQLAGQKMGVASSREPN